MARGHSARERRLHRRANAPIALIGLFEGWTAVLIAAAITAVSRL